MRAWIRGAVVLTCSMLGFAGGAAAGPIENPSFDDGGRVWFPTRAEPIPGWTLNADTIGYNGYITSGTTRVVPTEGRQHAYLYNLVTSTSTVRRFPAGSFISLSQVVDFSDVTALVFDAHLIAPPTDVWNPGFVAGLYVDGAPIWTSQTIGAYLDEVVDTTLLTGLHTLEMRLGTDVGVSSWNNSNHFYLDDLRAIPEPSTGLMVGLGLLYACAVRHRRACPRHPSSLLEGA